MSECFVTHARLVPRLLHSAASGSLTFSGGYTVLKPCKLVFPGQSSRIRTGHNGRALYLRSGDSGAWNFYDGKSGYTKVLDSGTAELNRSGRLKYT